MIKPIKKLRFLNREKAQTMVEFALVFPIVLLITYGLIEFGRMVFIYSAVTGAAREGARYGAAAGSDVSYPPPANNPHQYATCSGIRDAVRSTAFLIDNPTIGIRYDKGPGLAQIAATCEALVPDDIGLGDRIIVTITTHYTPWIAFLGLHGFDITSTNARTILVNIPIEP